MTIHTRKISDDSYLDRPIEERPYNDESKYWYCPMCRTRRVAANLRWMLATRSHCSDSRCPSNQLHWLRCCVKCGTPVDVRSIEPETVNEILRRVMS